MPAEDSFLCFGFKKYKASYKVELRSWEPGKRVAFNSLICWGEKKGAVFTNAASFFPVRKIMCLATKKLLLK